MQIARIHDTTARTVSAELADYLDARAAHDRASARLEQAGQVLLDQMRYSHQKSMKYEKDGVSRTVTFVQKTTPVINEQGLRKALKARVYDKFTVKKLDRKALEAAMSDGTIDPMTVSKYVELKEGKPYLHYTEKVDE